MINGQRREPGNYRNIHSNSRIDRRGSRIFSRYKIQLKLDRSIDPRNWFSPGRKKSCVKLARKSPHGLYWGGWNQSLIGRSEERDTGLGLLVAQLDRAPIDRLCDGIHMEIIGHLNGQINVLVNIGHDAGRVFLLRVSHYLQRVLDTRWLEWILVVVHSMRHRSRLRRRQRRRWEERGVR